MKHQGIPLLRMTPLLLQMPLQMEVLLLVLLALEPQAAGLQEKEPQERELLEARDQGRRAQDMGPLEMELVPQQAHQGVRAALQEPLAMQLLMGHPRLHPQMPLMTLLLMLLLMALPMAPGLASQELHQAAHRARARMHQGLQ